jgi:hypothetical protein
MIFELNSEPVEVPQGSQSRPALQVADVKFGHYTPKCGPPPFVPQGKQKLRAIEPKRQPPQTAAATKVADLTTGPYVSVR